MNAYYVKSRPFIVRGESAPAPEGWISTGREDARYEGLVFTDTPGKAKACLIREITAIFDLVEPLDIRAIQSCRLMGKRVDGVPGLQQFPDPVPAALLPIWEKAASEFWVKKMPTELDYDLQACLEHNPQEFTAEAVEKVLAVWEGQNDGDDWRWVLLLKDGRYAFLQGGCDYTGWDCQSWATSRFADDAETAARYALGDIEVGESSPVNAGVGHVIAIFSGTYMNNAQAVYESLLEQLKNGKRETWREKMDKEFGLGGQDE